MVTRAIATAAITALVAVTGCKLDAGNFDDRACTSQVDCRPDQTCSEGLCAQSECAVAEDCGPGYEYSCVEGGCVVRSCSVTEDCGSAGTCVNGFCGLACLGTDTDADGVCQDADNCPALTNRDQADTDADGAGDACDVCPADENNDADADAVCGDVDNCPNIANALQLDTDGDVLGDDCDPDDDNDGIVDANDPSRLNPDLCGDADADACDDCTIGTDNFGPLSDSTPNTDGPDLDGDFRCNAGDTDDDGDGKLDTADNCPQGELGWTSGPTNDRDADGCRDASEDLDDDNDTRPDLTDACPIGDLGWTSTAATDHDTDGCRDASEDLDDDGDGVSDAGDSCALGDVGWTADAATDHDADGCRDAGEDLDDDNDGRGDSADVCPLGVTGWTSTPATDLDADGCRDVGEDLDDDNDGVVDGSDPDRLDPDVCGDSDTDSCDDCAVGTDNLGPLPDGIPSDDGLDSDADGACNAGDSDDDNDGVADGADSGPLDPFQCRDTDADGCDDCVITGGPASPANDGADTDADGACNTGDADDDNDGRNDTGDPDDANPSVCGRDADTDSCDDCAGGGDGFGPLPNDDPDDDGTDTDADGRCNPGDADDDNDGVGDGADVAALDPSACGDTDTDSCDDCSGGVDGFGPLADSDPANDGTDSDADGACNAGDGDDDNDTVFDASDNFPLDPNRCQDVDADTCDDCRITGGPPSTTNDGTDTDADLMCNLGDPDDDNDTVPDAQDSAPLNNHVCRNLDGDGCNDCAVTGGPPSTTNDGPDTDADGQCNASDTCTDVDGDGVGNGNLGNSGCAVATVDSNDNNPNVCADTDADTCNDCVSGTYAPAADGLDTDVDGGCNASDTDDDNDGRLDGSDPFPFDPTRCGLDVDSDTCDDCAVGVDGFGPLPDNNASADGTDADADGICVAADCDDSLAHCTTDCTDVDGDQWCLPQDCNDCIPTCGNDCMTNTDAEGAANCVEDFCGSNPLSATSVCRIATTAANLNTAIAGANAATGRDFILLNANITLTTSPTHLIDNTGVEIRQCVGTKITANNPGTTDLTVFEVDGNNNEIEGVTIENATNGDGYIMVQLDGNNNTVNECTLTAFEQAGVYVTGDNNLIVDNRISNGGNAHVVGAGAVSLTSTALDNQIVGNVLVQNASDGVHIIGADGTFLDHNTIANNGDDGVDFSTSSPVSNTCVRNNIIASNTEYAIQRVDAPLTWNTTAACTGVLTAGKYGNDAFGNGLAVCGTTGTGGCNACSCLPGGNATNFFEFNVTPGFVTTLLTMPEAYCISSTTLINAMDSLGYDVNGDDPGLYTGSAPDGGGRESASGVCP